MASTRKTPAAAPPAGPLWDDAERAAWSPPPDLKPSEWAERYRRLHRGARKGPWRNANAPYSRGIMDVSTRPGVVQANVEKAGQAGVSEAVRNLMAYWAHVDPDPMCLVLPNRAKGRSIVKADVLPLFRETPVLRDLIGRPGRDDLLEEIHLMNGFRLDLFWSGSPAAFASHPERRAVNDEVDKFDPWRGEEPDAVAGTEVRITTYGDARLQINVSTPSTTAGLIHQLYTNSSVRLHWSVPCPHCHTRHRMRWSAVRWYTAARARAELAAIAKTLSANPKASAVDVPLDHCGRLALKNAAALRRHAAWLSQKILPALDAAEGRRGLADVLSAHREAAVWTVCPDCAGRVRDAEKAAAIREGRWTTDAGFVVDAAGTRHEDAETVTRWPWETRVGFHVSGLHVLWIHWGLLVSEWLRAQGNPKALFEFTTQRLGEPFEFRLARTGEPVFASKARRATLPAGVVPRWAWALLATVDTQPDHFYVVVRAWGGGLRSQRVYHGKLATFDELDHLLLATTWPVAGGEFPPMPVALAFIDSGGTADVMLDASRTQQVYQYVIPRQPLLRAIKGASRPGVGLYWPMKNPMADTAATGGKAAARAMAAFSRLDGLMVDTHRANDLLAALIVTGIPAGQPGHVPASGAGDAAGEPAAGEQWLLNQAADADYDAHMAGVQRTVDPRTGRELWTPRAPGARHDYRDCEAYQVVAAYAHHVHLLPDETEVLIWKAVEAARAAKPPTETQRDEPGGGWTPTPL